MAQKMSNTALMLVGGSVMGAGLALLFAPCSGAKSRKRMTRLGKEVGKKSERMVKDLTESMYDFADTMGSMGKKASGVMRKW